MFAVKVWGCLVLSTTTVMAQDYSTILGTDPGIFGGQRQPAQAATLQNVEQRSPFAVRAEVFPRFALKGYQVSGQGLNVSVPAASALGIGARIQGERWRLGGGWERSWYSGLPDSVSPSVAAAQDWRVHADLSFLKVGPVTFAAGYHLFGRIADQNAPQNILSTYFAHGPRFAVFSEWTFGRWSFLSDAHVAIPWFFHEATQITGGYTFGLNAQLRLLLGYAVVEGLKIGVGLDGLFQSFFFSGAGARGTVNAGDWTYGLGIPVVVQYAF